MKKGSLVADKTYFYYIACLEQSSTSPGWIDLLESGSFSFPSHRPRHWPDELNAVRPAVREGWRKSCGPARASEKARLVLIRTSLASSCYGQKRRVEASVSYFEVFIERRMKGDAQPFTAQVAANKFSIVF